MLGHPIFAGDIDSIEKVPNALGLQDPLQHIQRQIHIRYGDDFLSGLGQGRQHLDHPVLWYQRIDFQIGLMVADEGHEFRVLMTYESLHPGGNPIVEVALMVQAVRRCVRPQGVFSLAPEMRYLGGGAAASKVSGYQLRDPPMYQLGRLHAAGNQSIEDIKGNKLQGAFERLQLPGKLMNAVYLCNAHANFLLGDSPRHWFSVIWTSET